MSATPRIAPHPEIADVHCVSASTDAWPRPFVGIVGGMHGNEPCGRIAIETLAEEIARGDLSIRCGTLFLIHGNPQASAQGTRHTENGTDLNRLFSFEFVDNLPEKRWVPEHRRALELRDLLLSLDAALDLHSATAPTPPFGIVSKVPESALLARKLGLPYLTHGWEGPGMLGDRVMMHMLTHRAKPSLAVECGQHDDPRAIDRAWNTARHFLVAMNMIGSEEAPVPAPEPALELNIVDAVKKPSPGFVFMGRFLGLQELPAGHAVGCDDNLEIRCRRKSFVIMPNAAVAVGQDMLYLAQQIDPATHVPED